MLRQKKVRTVDAKQDSELAKSQITSEMDISDIAFIISRHYDKQILSDSEV